MKKLTAAAIQSDGTVICPGCKLPHALFYKRSSDTKRELLYLCRKHQRKTFDAYGRPTLRTVPVTRKVEFADNLQIEERWTKKYAKLVESRQYAQA